MRGTARSRICAALLLLVFSLAGGARQPVQGKQLVPFSQPKEIRVPTLSRNPKGFTATTAPRGEVILSWTPVPNAISYTLQGPGVQPGTSRPGSGPVPVNVTGTTYTVKGLPAGTHSWTLLSLFSGPSGPYVPDPGNPSKVSLTLAVNPSGFSASAGPGGDVILRWNPVPGAITYNLQGAGVPAVAGMPPNVPGTSYTVKGLPAGTHSWVLFAVYNGPSGPNFGDERNPARISLTLAGSSAPATSGRWTRFDPAKHGFRFINSFRNNLIGPPVNMESRGLCGGMSYASLDYYHANRPIPDQTFRPANGTPIQAYLYARQTASLATSLDKWLELSVNPLGARTLEFFNWGLKERLLQIKSSIDRGMPVPLGLKGSEGSLSHDHQVLAIGYDTGRYKGDLGSYQEDLRIFISDPNYPKQTLTLTPNPGAKEYFYREHPENRWRTYFVDGRYASVPPPASVNPSYPPDGLVYELLFEFNTGQDDLRGGADHADLTIRMANNTSQTYTNITQNGRLLPLYMETVQIILRQPVPAQMIRSLEISTNAASGLGGDNWDLLSVRVKAVGGGFTRDLVSRQLAFRFTGARTLLVLNLP